LFSTARGAARLLLFVVTILFILKVIVGAVTGSISVWAQAVDSSLDIFAVIITFLTLGFSSKPADREHPFGHGKVEDISALAEALLIFIAAVWIIYEAVHKLINPRPLETVNWGVAVMLFSVVANVVVSQLLFKIGKKTESPALIADAWHLRTDVYTSAGVMAGLAFIWLGSVFLPSTNLVWLDAAAAILVALLICRAALRLTMDAIKDLIDTSPSQEEVMWLSRYLGGWYPTVRSVHRLRTRKSGAERFIDLHVVVDPAMSVTDSHAITEKMTSEIRAQLNGADVTVHIEPCDGTCKASCVSGCLLPLNSRKSMQSAAATRPRKEP
jgi:cation diffusion facilitator family transporter